MTLQTPFFQFFVEVGGTGGGEMLHAHGEVHQGVQILHRVGVNENGLGLQFVADL